MFLGNPTVDGISNLEADQNCMCLVNQPHHDRSLFDCFLRIFYLKYPTLRGAVRCKEISDGAFQLGRGARWNVIQGNRIVIIVVPKHYGSLEKVIIVSEEKL